jgi:hypothetical protein
MTGTVRTAMWLIGLIFLVLLSCPARGQVRVLVLEPQSPFLPASQLASLTKNLADMAGEYPDLERVDSPGIAALQKNAGCSNTSPKCLRAMGRTAGAQRVLFTQVQKLPGRHLLLMRLIDVASGRQLKQARLRTRQGRAALRNSLTQAFRNIFGVLSDVRLEINANIEDADISLDGRPLGKTPLVITSKLNSGRHSLSALHDDCEPAEYAFQIKPGRNLVRHRFDLRLLQAADDIAPVALVPRVALADGPGAGKLKDEEPGAGKLKDEEPGAGKLKDEEPGAGKLKDEEPGAGKLKDEEPGAGKLKDEAPGKAKAADDSIAGPLLRKRPDDGATRPNTGLGFLPEQPGDPKPAPEPEPDRPIYKAWWFWTAIGAVAVAGAVTGTVLGLAGDEGIASGRGRVNIHF